MNKKRCILFLCSISLFIFTGCAKLNPAKVDSSAEAKHAASKYKRMASDLEERFKKQSDHQAIEDVQNKASYHHSPEFRSKNLRTEDHIAEWIIYPYEDRYGMKYDLGSVHAIVHEADWISDHGAVPDGVKSRFGDKVNKHKSYYYKHQAGPSGTSK